MSAALKAARAKYDFADTGEELQIFLRPNYNEQSIVFRKRYYNPKYNKKNDEGYLTSEENLKWAEDKITELAQRDISKRHVEYEVMRE